MYCGLYWSKFLGNTGPFLWGQWDHLGAGMGIEATRSLSLVSDLCMSKEPPFCFRVPCGRAHLRFFGFWVFVCLLACLLACLPWPRSGCACRLYLWGTSIQSKMKEAGPPSGVLRVLKWMKAVATPGTQEPTGLLVGGEGSRKVLGTRKCSEQYLMTPVSIGHCVPG